MTTVLFVCVHNAGRSQMAEAFLNALAQERGLPFQAISAGTERRARLNPVVVEAMREVGVPLEGHTPKLLTQSMVDQADMIIGMGCGVDASACPARFLMLEDWGLDDPAGQGIESVRKVRDDIRRRVADLLARGSVQ